MLKTWAQAMGDSEEVAYLDKLIAAGKDAMQKYLWKGDHYLVYNDPKTGKTLDAFFSADAQWTVLTRISPACRRYSPRKTWRVFSLS